MKISSGVTKRIFQGNEIQFLEECEPSQDTKGAFGKHEQYGYSDTDLSQSILGVNESFYSEGICY